MRACCVSLTLRLPLPPCRPGFDLEEWGYNLAWYGDTPLEPAADRLCVVPGDLATARRTTLPLARVLDRIKGDVSLAGNADLWTAGSSNSRRAVPARAYDAKLADSASAAVGTAGVDGASVVDGMRLRAAVSNDPGLYICNFMYFAALSNVSGVAHVATRADTWFRGVGSGGCDGEADCDEEDGGSNGGAGSEREPEAKGAAEGDGVGGATEGERTLCSRDGAALRRAGPAATGPRREHALFLHVPSFETIPESAQRLFLLALLAAVRDEIVPSPSRSTAAAADAAGSVAASALPADVQAAGSGAPAAAPEASATAPCAACLAPEDGHVRMSVRWKAVVPGQDR